MSNLYASLAIIKNRLAITATDWDADMLRLAGSASRFIDNFIRRRFYIWEGIRYYDGDKVVKVLNDDLQSITMLAVDLDGDGVYESTFAVTDYFAMPHDSTPKTWLEINPNGSYSSLGDGVHKALKVTGLFGYGNDWPASYLADSGDTVQNDPSISATATTLTVVSGALFSPGQTLRIESEQLYVSAVSSNNLTVERGVNGTTGAVHVKTKAISIYQYPEPVRDAALIQCARWWKRKDSAYQDAVGMAELGQVMVYKGLDADVRLMLEPYIKRRFA